jgi:hypothetical protein
MARYLVTPRPGNNLTGFSGSFYEFSPVIKPLTESWTSTTGKNVSYHVVVPSLPGFVFSSPSPQNWTVDDDARIFNTLMSEVLGYSTFAVHGKDWVMPLPRNGHLFTIFLSFQGSVIGYSLYSAFTITTRAAHFVFLPFLPPTAEEIAANNITLSDEQKVTLQRGTEWFSTGIAYFMEQENKVCFISHIQMMWVWPLRGGCLTFILDSLDLAVDCR